MRSLDRVLIGFLNNYAIRLLVHSKNLVAASSERTGKTAPVPPEERRFEPSCLDHADAKCNGAKTCRGANPCGKHGFPDRSNQAGGHTRR